MARWGKTEKPAESMPVLEPVKEPAPAEAAVKKNPLDCPVCSLPINHAGKHEGV